MKRLTLKQAEERIAQLDHDATKAMLAMNALAANWVVWLPRFKGEDGSYRLGYFGLHRADGGLVLTQWTQDGEKPYTRVEYLDDAYGHYHYHAPYSREAEQFREGIAKIMRERNIQLEQSKSSTAA